MNTFLYKYENKVTTNIKEHDFETTNNKNEWAYEKYHIARDNQAHDTMSSKLKNINTPHNTQYSRSRFLRSISKSRPNSTSLSKSSSSQQQQ